MARMRTAALLLVLASCGTVDPRPPIEDDAGASPADAASADATVIDAGVDAAPPIDAGPDAPPSYPHSDLDVGCAPVFAQNILPEFHFTIAADEWAAMEQEFLHPQLSSGGAPLEPPYHPTQLRIVEGAVEHQPTGVMVRLNGNTSWLQTIALDANPKMQFLVAFNKVDPDGRFEGMRKIKLDMPRSDWTYLQQRVGLAWLRGRAGIPAQCANSARVFINGAYHGLYANVEFQDKSFLERTFGDGDNDGDLWKAGREIKTNEETFTWTRINAFWAQETLAGLDQWVEVDASMVEWASEAVIGDTDGYNQGRPNYYVYDRPSTQRFLWLANDLDTVLDEDFLEPDTTPVMAPTPPGQGRWERDWHHYLVALNDPAGPPRYAQAMRQQLPKLDPAELAMWIDDWSAQVAGAVADDPHRTISLATHAESIVRMKSYSPARRAYLQEWVDCWDGGGADADGDGFVMCRDCDDHDSTQSPAAVEVCDDIDNNCDGRVDNVSAGTCTADPMAAQREAQWRRIHVDVKAEKAAARMRQRRAP